MTRPTKEQLEQARANLAKRVDSAPWGLREDIRILLSATAEPTDEELCAEFDALLKRKQWTEKVGELYMYAAGARREGAR